MIAILTSGVALGVHVPGLLLASRLGERGAKVVVEVIERLLPDDRLRMVEASRSLFHRDFRVARAGQRLAADPAQAIDDAALVALHRRWRQLGVQRVVVFSGFWLGALGRLSALGLRVPEVTICQVDSVESPSFQRAAPSPVGTQVFRLASSASSDLPCTIPVTRRPPVRWPERGGRLLVHGGGWGMGTYRQRAADLSAAGHALDLVVHELDEAASAPAGTRAYLMDPSWHPWHDDGYPPLGHLAPGQDPRTVKFRRGTAHHSSFDLAREAIAMVSKPGGGTLLDSLWSATPLVLLEPSGQHEEHNARLWCDLGFGIRFEQWQDAGFVAEYLRPLHEALLTAGTGPARPLDMVEALCARKGSSCMR
ncbi:hypothetical protein RI578_42305 (plasmid) [Streptomyces sp. BB1-1-1]|uniref:hypothetical protein n=1 Tax=Streptomyces sp. BB1-1-1 TaxID=3074430 RepID=UPI0028779FBB|nr:hypothetical protein [Streptomyces sp. BB1-1-1]WND32854.1 hypothetical protein RI578_00330 [Streptomyces sp. BB1-1-1]WND40078.1 hypothetical protein RI578_40075 [Streptomyces sp. BB1-1-1]WND40912.1 hypothetical protein RI578_42305 [Streptomyces sp. BB1-1-1]